MTFNFLQPRTSHDPAQIDAIKRWVREALAVPTETDLMITELRCSESGCPPIGMVITLLVPDMPLSESIRQYKIPKPIAEVTHEDVVTTTNVSRDERHGQQ